MAFEDPFLEPALVVVKRQKPVLGIFEHQLGPALCRTGIYEFGGVEVTATAVLTLVALSGGMMTVRALTDDIAVGEELPCFLVVELLRGLLDEFTVVVELAEEIACELMVRGRGGAAIHVEADTELLEGVLDHLVVTIHDLLRRDAFLACALRHRHTVLVRPAYEHHFLALQAQVPYIDVRRHVHAREVADVHPAVGVGQRRRHRRSLEALFHILLCCFRLDRAKVGSFSRPAKLFAHFFRFRPPAAPRRPRYGRYSSVSPPGAAAFHGDAQPHVRRVCWAAGIGALTRHSHFCPSFHFSF